MKKIPTPGRENPAQWGFFAAGWRPSFFKGQFAGAQNDHKKDKQHKNGSHRRVDRAGTANRVMDDGHDRQIFHRRRGVGKRLVIRPRDRKIRGGHVYVRPRQVIRQPMFQPYSTSLKFRLPFAGELGNGHRPIRTAPAGGSASSARARTTDG